MKGQAASAGYASGSEPIATMWLAGANALITPSMSRKRGHGRDVCHAASSFGVIVMS